MATNLLREYIREILSEMAAPRQSDLAQVYYHGTPKEAYAKSIMANGIKVPDLSTRSGNLKPVEGKVYITPKICFGRSAAEMQGFPKKIRGPLHQN